MPRTYIEVDFKNDGSGRRYTYHVDDDVSIGDEVEVETRAGSLLSLRVLNVLQEAPSFPTKSAVKV